MTSVVHGSCQAAGKRENNYSAINHCGEVHLWERSCIRSRHVFVDTKSNTSFRLSHVSPKPFDFVNNIHNHSIILHHVCCGYWIGMRSFYKRRNGFESSVLEVITYKQSYSGNKDILKLS